MSVRVYVPVTSSLLASLVEQGRLSGPFAAHAVTPALQEQWPEADADSWEYAALMAAASVSAAMGGPGDLPRRYVIAADVPDFEPAPGEDPTAVEVTADLPWRNVASAHVDTVDHADEDDELAWFATQEIPHLP